MEKQYHYLKIAPQYFKAVKDGTKTFEVRFNDRNFQVGDVLHLMEYDNGKTTGRIFSVEVTYLLDDPQYCKEGYVVMAIKPIRMGF